MDRVRFGRALGFGARAAVKTLLIAVDAATTADPSGKSASANGGQTAPLRRAMDVAAKAAIGVVQSAGQVTVRTQPETATRKAVHSAARTVDQVRGAQSGLRRGTRRFGEAVWGPVVRLSGVLWLEVSGVFFGVFALFALGAALRFRGQWHASGTNAGGHRNFLVAVAMLLVFGYFCVSNFVQARRRERQR